MQRELRAAGYYTAISGKFLNAWNVADDAKPWFMQVSPLAPHGPATPEKQFTGVPVPL